MTITAAAEGTGVPAGFAFWRRYQHWINLFALATADAISFGLSDLLFRIGRKVPVFLVTGSTPSLANARTIDIFAFLAISFIVVRYLSSDYSRRQLFWDSARRSTIALLIAAIPDLFLVSFNVRAFSVFSVICSWLFLVFAIPLCRQLARLLLAKAGVWFIPTALIGSGGRAAATYTALSRSLSLGFQVRWSAANQGAPLDLPHVVKIGVTNPVEITDQLIAQHCGQVVVTDEDTRSDAYAETVQRLLEADIAVAVVPSFQRLPLVGATTNYFFGHDLLLLQVRSNLRRLPQRIEKRIFDVLGAASLLVLFSPLFLFIAFAIKRHDGGRVTYSQKRVGLNGEIFDCIKFRTMAMDAEERLLRWRDEKPNLYEEYLKTFKLRDDPRITAPGQWLRKASLDELPQLVNVLRGEMSLVGPRPVVEKELHEYYGPAAQLYIRVRPGLTGLWQVSGRSDTTYEERVIFDEWYILNWSFWYDIVILIQTAGIVLSGRGAY